VPGMRIGPQQGPHEPHLAAEDAIDATDAAEDDAIEVDVDVVREEGVCAVGALLGAVGTVCEVFCDVAC
jgi:hypothetical protein